MRNVPGIEFGRGTAEGVTQEAALGGREVKSSRHSARNRARQAAEIVVLDVVHWPNLTVVSAGCLLGSAVARGTACESRQVQLRFSRFWVSFASGRATSSWDAGRRL